MKASIALRNGYDAFISHNHADKDFARELARRLADMSFQGRPLRPWLDEQFLDPGELGQNAELTSALDRSRKLLLVLSPASVASQWVKFEVDYFLRDRKLDDVIPVLKSPCDLPPTLGSARPLDFTNDALFEDALLSLLAQLCPPMDPSPNDAQTSVAEAWDAALAADAGGFVPGPTSQRDGVLAALMQFDIDDPSGEGLALTGFGRAAELLLRDHQRGHPAAYNMKMLLGECLSVAVRRNARYRQVAQRYLDLEPDDTEDPVLLLVVARAYSKVAEIDPALIDLGALRRIAAQLDLNAPLNNKKASVAMMLGRIAAKLRGTDLGDLLIQALKEGGPAGRVAAIGGISTAQSQAPSEFYLSDLVARGPEAGGGSLEPPSRKLLALLFAIELDQPPIVAQQVQLAKADLLRAFSISEIPYAYSWFALRKEAPPPHAHRAPFMGTVIKATTANMEEVALRLDASHTVCLTEPRIVDALFDRAGSLLIPVQDVNSPQCRRLAGRGVPFAMLDAQRMTELKDGSHVEIEKERMRVVS